LEYGDARDLNNDPHTAIVNWRRAGEIGKATSAFPKSVFMKIRTRLGQGWWFGNFFAGRTGVRYGDGALEG
jgi:hypothetical protein